MASTAREELGRSLSHTTCPQGRHYHGHIGSQLRGREGDSLLTLTCREERTTINYSVAIPSTAPPPDTTTPLVASQNLVARQQDTNWYRYACWHMHNYAHICMMHGGICTTGTAIISFETKYTPYQITASTTCMVCKKTLSEISYEAHICHIYKRTLQVTLINQL